MRDVKRLPSLLRCVGPVALLLPSVAAQVIVVSQNVERRVTRVVWFCAEGRREVSVDYGPAAWRDRYEAFLRTHEARHIRLGTDGWTRLRSDVDLRFGERRVPAGSWYVGLERAADDAWSITLLASAKVDALGLGAGSMAEVTPDIRVHVALSDRDSHQERLAIELAVDAADPQRGELKLHLGRHGITAPFVAAIGAPLPTDVPEFDATPAARLMTTASGLQYRQLREGVGPSPTMEDKVRVHYAGWLADGTLFDSSYSRNEAATFPLTGVIKGFCEGLQLMQTGAEFQFTIPPALGYGEMGVAPLIPPNSTLVFRVTLLGIER